MVLSREDHYLTEFKQLEMHLNLLNFTDSSGILLAVDFEKSFDSLNYFFLLKILEKFNFGTQFISGSKPSTLMYQVVP